MVADKQHAWLQVYEYEWYIDDILKMDLAVPESSYTKDVWQNFKNSFLDLTKIKSSFEPKSSGI